MKKLRLTKKQKEALFYANDDGYISFGQSEVNLNSFYYINADNNVWWKCITVDSLIEKGFLIRDNSNFDVTITELGKEQIK